MPKSLGYWKSLIEIQSCTVPVSPSEQNRRYMPGQQIKSLSKCIFFHIEKIPLGLFHHCSFDLVGNVQKPVQHFSGVGLILA